MGRTKKEKPSSFGATLTALMADKRMSVADAARTAQVSTSVLVGWRAGKAPQDFEACQRLADRLGVSLSYLLLGRKDKPLKPPTIDDVFEDGRLLFDGYLKVRIERMIARSVSGDRKVAGGDDDEK